ncbi:monovalent cation/H(+) antiporter subunit G [Roseomonas populi]|uniref:Monovalent cation/H(+) antiporter subunit G n=1 Tax=Roseomonas populi TaxID=3121582 RepID=A0ABT1X0I2_9PROT|nr:monovalent cation/H(+) antiporter subunit G [Roseomonas pecuniae]MCR0981234.1 monovalent cation/H(+) antiporter subunit G [Roseomonas pecuniae]
MTEALVGALLAAMVAAAWLAAAGAARLRGPLNRLHAVAFVNIACGLPLAVAAFVTDGASARALKVAAIVLLSWLVGAATSHATGRALVKREEAR